MSWHSRWWKRLVNRPVPVEQIVGPLFARPDDGQPRFGYVDHHNGTRSPVRFMPTKDPYVFLAVDLSGNPMVVDARDVFFVDVIGPGQSVQFTVSKTS